MRLYKAGDSAGQEKFSRQYDLKRRGYDLEKIEQRACELYEMGREELYERERQKQRVEAQSLAIY
ncbi:MAG: hypothetical protein NTZ51_11330 [Proteobacteria bacterium]|nr:hypothetical protein [Pseudomonadota bacterium]